MRAHPAVLGDPEPLVLIDRLGAATINLRAYFWYDGTTHNGFKVRSALIRRVKRAFQEQGISMPDEAREVVFPRGCPGAHAGTGRGLGAGRGRPRGRTPERAPEQAFTAAEGEVVSEQEELRGQAPGRADPGRGGRPPGGG